MRGITGIFGACLLFLSCHSVNSGRILVWYSLAATSNKIAMDAFVRGLTKSNHSVTYLVHKIPKWAEEEKSVEFINLGVDFASLFKDVNMFDFSPLTFSLPTEKLVQAQADFFNSPELQYHMKNTKFDLMIVTSTVLDMGLHLAKHVFKVPFIIFSAGFSDAWTAISMGNPINPSYIPSDMADLSSRMTFLQRVQNILLIKSNIEYRRSLTKPVEAEIRRLFKDDTIDLEEIHREAQLLIVNQHSLFDKAKPLNPNTIFVGGIHINEERTPLSADIKKWLDEAEHGAIYISFGSITQGSAMPAERREAITQALSQLKQKVLWKWETEEMQNQPKNVMLKKWCPQQDILAHPNVKLFVTHGGLLSTYESVYFATPMLVIPGFLDQFASAHFVENRGLGDQMRWSEVTKEAFQEKLLSVLNNPAISAQVLEYSQIFRDEPMKPVDKAVFYAEYVMRHKGAAHLRPSSLDLHWYQYFLIDVILFFGIILIAIALCLKQIIALLLRLCKNQKSVIKSNKKKSPRKKE